MGTSVAEPLSVAPTDSRSRGLEVYMMDLLSYVPYYTGHLSAALSRL